jgi:glucokinase
MNSMSDLHNHDESPVLGVEIGGTKLQVGFGTATGKLWRVWRCAARPEGGARAILGDIYGLIGQALRHGEEAGWGRPTAIGVGFGGPVDSSLGTTLISHQVEGWRDFPLVATFSDRFGIPVVLENDASTAALGEARVGAGKGLGRVFYVTVGSGIGGGWVVDGRLDRGQGRGMAEIGHVICQDEQGNRVALEKVASGWGIQEWARTQAGLGEGARLLERLGGDIERMTTEEISRYAALGDAFSARMLERGARYLGGVLANAITLLAPERIVIGGGVSLAGAAYWAPLREEVEKQVFHLFRGQYELVPAALGEHVVMIGAFLLAGEAE